MLIDYRQAHEARLLVAITFHYGKQRLPALFQVVKTLSGFPVAALDIVVATNTTVAEEIESIRRMCAPLLGFASKSPGCFKSLEVRCFAGLAHPYLLPWAHKHLIVGQFLKGGGGHTHYVCLEDDIEFSFPNFCYFLTYRPALQRSGLLPSFLRVEYNFADDQLYCTDQLELTRIDNRRIVKLDRFWFMNMERPYTGMFILDHALAREYVASRSFDVEASGEVVRWGIRERAAMGLTFENVPAGFSSRYVVPANPIGLSVPGFAYIYHTANNYTNNPDEPLGKMLITRLFSHGELPIVAVKAL